MRGGGGNEGGMRHGKVGKWAPLLWYYVAWVVIMACEDGKGVTQAWVGLVRVVKIQ